MGASRPWNEMISSAIKLQFRNNCFVAYQYGYLLSIKTYSQHDLLPRKYITIIIDSSLNILELCWPDDSIFSTSLISTILKSKQQLQVQVHNALRSFLQYRHVCVICMVPARGTLNYLIYVLHRLSFYKDYIEAILQNLKQTIFTQAFISWLQFPKYRRNAEPAISRVDLGDRVLSHKEIYWRCKAQGLNGDLKEGNSQVSFRLHHIDVYNKILCY